MMRTAGMGLLALALSACGSSSGSSSDDTGYSNSGTYCVQGNTLHLVDVDMSMNMGPMGQATITDDVTLTKQ